MRIKRESIDERRAARLVYEEGGFLLKWVCPSLTGVPDRIFFPGHGRIYFIEWKAPGEEPSGPQRVFARILDQLGFKVYVVHGLQEFFELCRIERLPIYNRWLSRGLVSTPMG